MGVTPAGAAPATPRVQSAPAGRSRFWWDSARTTAASALGQGPSLLVAPAAAYTLGANAASDAAFLALSFATAFVTTLAGATQFAAVPFLIRSSDGSDRSAAFLNSVTALVIVFSAVVAAAVAFGAAAYARWRDPAYGQVALYLALLSPFTVTAAAITLLTGALTAARDYVAAAISPLWRWVIVLAFLLLFGAQVGPLILIAGYTLGELIRLVLIGARVRSHFGRMAVSFRRSQFQAVRPFLRAASSQLIASALIAVLPIVDRLMASTLPPGSVSVLEYADRLWQVPVGFAVSGLLVVALSDWSRDAREPAGLSAMSARTGRVAAQLGFACVGPCLLVFAYRHQLVGALFGQSVLNPQEIGTLADAFGWYIAGIPVYVACLTYARAFLALKRSEWLIIVALAELVFKLVTNPLFLSNFGLPGLAMATSAMYVVGLVLLVGQLPLAARAGAREQAV